MCLRLRDDQFPDEAMERRFGSFHRSVTLPRQLSAENAEAAFEDGVLTIRIPRSEEAKPKQLEIK